MTDDITDTLAPKSDQLDAVDLLGGSRIFTVERVVVNTTAEQPVTVHLAEFPRPWKPGKNMRRVLGNIWGKKGSEWVGRRIELYCDLDVRFGGEAVGGVRILRMSHISKRTGTPIIPTRGKSGIYNVDPLPDGPATASEPTPEDLAQRVVSALADTTTEAEVREWGNRAHARNLLDVQINGQTVKSHVEYRLAELAEPAEDGAQ